MRMAILNENVKILVAWKFVRLKKGTEVIDLQDNSNGISSIKLKSGKYKGRIINIDSSVITVS